MTAPATATQTRQTTVAQEILEIDRAVRASVETSAARKRMAPFLSAGQSYDRIAAQVRESMIKTPKLAECDPNTIVDAVVTIQRWRLEIGETAYLVPFRTGGRQVCTPVRGYIGDIELLINNGIARRVDAFCVYKNEPFTYREGTSPLLEHQPLAPSQRGALIGAYAILWQTFTNSKAVFLYAEEIEEIREKFSKQWKQEQVGALPTWYAKKCAVKAVTKLLPKSPKLAKLREQMDEDEIVVQSVERGISATRPAHVDDDGVDLEDEEEVIHEPVVARPTSAPVMRFGKTKGTPLANLELRELKSARKWAAETDEGKFAAAIAELDAEIRRKESAQSNTQGDIPGLDDAAPSRNALAQP